MQVISTLQDGSVVHFKIKKNTPLKKLMTAYCERQGLSQGAIRFVFDGDNIEETDTPARVSISYFLVNKLADNR